MPMWHFQPVPCAVKFKKKFSQEQLIFDKYSLIDISIKLNETHKKFFFWLIWTKTQKEMRVHSRIPTNMH
jgi:hypothetical protein